MAVIGNFLGAAGKNTIEPSPALEMSEAETSFQAVVDPYAKADFFLTFGPGGRGIEEGYLTFTSLPGGLLVKVGKMRSAFGKVNQMHSHILPWTDRPLVTRSLVGGEDGISDSGISVSKLILNPIMFLEATGEVYRRQLERLQRAVARRPHLRWPPARVSRPHRGHEPRSRDVDRVRPQLDGA